MPTLLVIPGPTIEKDPYNTKKVRADRQKRNHADRLSDTLALGRAFLLHDPRHSTEKCKVLRDYSKKQAGQWPHKEYHKN